MRIHRLITVGLLLLAAFPGHAQTKLFLKNTASPLALNIATAYAGYGCNSFSGDHIQRVANTTQGGTTVTTTQSPSNGTPPCQTGSESGATYNRWITAPVSSGFTLSGNIDYSAGCRESANQLNAGFRFVVYRWSVADGGVVSTIHTSADTTECGTTAALRTIAAAAPTSTVMATGDRLVFVIEMRAVGGGWGGNGSRTFDHLYNGTAGSSGDSFVNFADTFTFSADVNNGRTVLSGRPNTNPLGNWLGALTAVLIQWSK
jgi:hypothetical protein